MSVSSHLGTLGADGLGLVSHQGARVRDGQTITNIRLPANCKQICQPTHPIGAKWNA
jgi:hypothetical protein